MPEYRYTGISPSRQSIQGVIKAKNRREADERIKEAAWKRRIQVTKVQPKRTYVYRVRKSGEAVIKGEMEAFSSDEIASAFSRMGYKILGIRKRLFNYRVPPPVKDVVLFIRLSADLIREKYPYDEALQLLANDVSHKNLQKAIREICKDLKDGKEGKEVFARQEKMLGHFPAYMLGVASQSGNMAEIYESTAKFMERIQDFKKSLRSALIMPSVTLFFLFLTVLFYIGYIFPKTAEMFVRYNIPLPPMTSAALDLSRFLKEYALILVGTVLILGIAAWRFFSSEKGKLWLDSKLIRLPVLGDLFHKTSIEIFCRVFYSLYSGSADNIEVIQVAAEACRNKHIMKRIKDVSIPLMLKEGKGLIESLKASGVFTENALTRLKSGAETGTLKTAALQVANFYEKETKYKLKAAVDWIQVLVAVVIALVLIIITVVSSETAIVRPKIPGMTM